MDDLISRQAAIDEFYKYPNIDWTTLDVLAKINALPSAQPEIIHCAECIHSKHSAERKSYCEVFDWMSKAEDFCSFAERRTDESKQN